MSDGGEKGGFLLNRRVEPFNHLRRDGDGAALEYLDGRNFNFQSKMW